MAYRGGGCPAPGDSLDEVGWGSEQHELAVSLFTADGLDWMTCFKGPFQLKQFNDSMICKGVPVRSAGRASPTPPSPKLSQKKKRCLQMARILFCNLKNLSSVIKVIF